jgi:hypothetical protein
LDLASDFSRLSGGARYRLFIGSASVQIKPSTAMARGERKSSA